MSSTSVLEPLVKTEVKTHNHKHQTKNSNNDKNSKRKNKHDRNGRKRSKSFSGCGIMMSQKPVLPTKFLLGGNINDPLNLNSLQDEEINRAMNAVTPKSSPVPTPPRRKGQIEVIIPANIHDPLNLIDCADDAEYEQQLCSPIKKGRKKRIKKRRTISATIEITEADDHINSEAKTPESISDSAKIPDVPEVVSSTSTSTETEVKPKVCKDLTIELSPKKDKNKRKSEEHAHTFKKFKHSSMDKIVSPVVPQPGAWLKRMNSLTRWAKPRQNNKVAHDNEVMPQFKEKNKQYQYGNYNRYYGYRNPNNEIDHRLRVFSHHSYLFENKDILDIGCNIGHVTLSVARDFVARSVTGIDIDQKLISIARKNIKNYVKSYDDEHMMHCPKKKSSEFFPISMPILYGAIDIPGFNDKPKGHGFPNNVTFKQCNYVLDDDSLVALEQPQFDIILCLSITKWIHLNWGDSGLKQAFRRMYAQLRPGGKLILEPQNWASYKSKRKLTETIYKTFNTIEFFPEKFTEYLLSPAVGFAKSEILGYPAHQSRGFRRPIQVFTKSTMFPSERVEATPINITPNNPVYNDSIYQRIMKTEKYESHQGDCVVEHVYTNIFNRYCTCMDDNIDVNNSIGESLKQETDSRGTSQNENSVDFEEMQTSNERVENLKTNDENEKIVTNNDVSMDSEEVNGNKNVDERVDEQKEIDVKKQIDDNENVSGDNT